MLITEIDRVFEFKSNGTIIQLEDIPDVLPEQVKNIYSCHYPELTNGSVEYRGIIDNKEVYEFKTIIGTKG